MRTSFLTCSTVEISNSDNLDTLTARVFNDQASKERWFRGCHPNNSRFSLSRPFVVSVGRKVPATQPRSFRRMEQVSTTSESSKTSAPQGSTCLASCSATYLAIAATILPVGHSYSASRSVFRTKAEQVFLKFECIFFRKTKVGFVLTPILEAKSAVRL